MPLKWFLIAGLSFAIGFSGWAARSQNRTEAKSCESD